MAAYAVQNESPPDRVHSETDGPSWTPFLVDRDRIVHSTAFRRLEYKTQVFVNHEGDLFRTRLTHTIEVAHLSRIIAQQLHLNDQLAEAIALAHDLGHAPFGHAGQRVLNDCARAFGGFEHNLQALRIVDGLERAHPNFPGLNLSYATREGILKHCSLESARNLGDLGKRFLYNQQPSLEAQLANIADEIAYTTHDIDDGLRSGLLEIGDLLTSELFRSLYDEVTRTYPDLSARRLIYETVRRMRQTLIDDLVRNTQQVLDTMALESVETVKQQPQPLLSFSKEITAQLDTVRTLLLKHLYHHYRVQRMSEKARQIIESLFHAFSDNANLLPDEAKLDANQAFDAAGADGQARIIVDYIAGMTDRYAIIEYQRLFDPLHRT